MVAGKVVMIAEQSDLFSVKILLPEWQAKKKGYSVIAGVDEAGRGPLAGPVVAAAVAFFPPYTLQGVDDSKKLSPPQRELLFEKIITAAKFYGTGIVYQEEIDRVNILQASLKAMSMAVADMGGKIDYLLVDGIFPVPSTIIPQLTLKKGDSRSPSIGAASIIAKVTRDRMMRNYHKEYPRYNFARNKGYGTKEHLDAIKKFGPCPLHRRTFKGVREYR